MPDKITYTINMPHQAAWIVYINGIEIPAVSVNVSWGIWMVPEAQIRLIPHTLLQRIGAEDRLQVVIFYFDDFFDATNPEFKLFGEFEVIGWGYSNTATGRYIELNCRGQVQIFEQLRFYYMSSIDDIVVGSAPAMATSADTVSSAMVHYPVSLFLHGLVQPFESNGNTVEGEDFIKSPFEFIQNIFKALVGKIDLDSEDASTADPGYLPRSAVSAPGRNFFARWIQKTDFQRRWAALPFFDDADAKSSGGCFPIIKAVQGMEVLDAIQQYLGQSVGSAGSAWELLQKVLGTTYMEITMIPAPPIAQLEKQTSLISGAYKSRGNADTTSYGSIVSHIVKPHSMFGLPPACNLIFPSMISTIKFDENYMNQPTRVYLGEQYISNILNAKNSGNVADLTKELLKGGYPPIVKARMDAYITDPKQNTKNFLIFPEELYKGPVSRHMNAPPWLYLLEQIMKGSEVIPESTEGTSIDSPIEKLKKGGASMTRKAIGPIVTKYAAKYHLPETFVYAVARGESGLKVKDTSWAGARGLMQIMSRTAKDLWERLQKKEGELRNFSEINPYDPEVNIHLGSFYLRSLCNKYKVKIFNKEELNPNRAKPSLLQIALMAYNNGGPKVDSLIADKTLMSYRRKDKNGRLRETPQWKFYSGLVLRGWKQEEAYLASAEGKEQLAQESDTTQKEQTWPGTTSTPANSSQVDTSGGIDDGASVQPPVIATNEAKEDEGFWKLYQTATETIANSSPLGELFDVYARYEYFRSRYENRSAVVNLAFNPYIVPGFPAVIFDAKESGFDIVGYVTSVNHSMSADRGAPGLSTTINLTFLRTLSEYIGVAQQDDSINYFPEFADQLDCGPMEPIPAVAAAFQDLVRADEFYEKVLYPGLAKEHVFDYERMLDFYDADDNPITIDILFDKWSPEQGLIARPKKEYDIVFESYDAAMSYASRPVTSLRQYIELYFGDTIANIIKDKKILGENLSFYSNLRTGRKSQTEGGATFWSRIYAYKQGPGNPDEETLSRVTNVDRTSSTMGPITDNELFLITSDMNIPQTRRDWDTILIKYRNIIRGNVAQV
jgi:hypothetical protein